MALALLARILTVALALIIVAILKILIAVLGMYLDSDNYHSDVGQCS